MSKLADYSASILAVLSLLASTMLSVYYVRQAKAEKAVGETVSSASVAIKTNN